MNQLSLFIDASEAAAKALIRVYVKRGDDMKWIQQPMGSSRPNGMSASIGGYIDGKKYGNDKIVVHRDMNGREVNQVFSFLSIYNSIKDE